MEEVMNYIVENQMLFYVVGISIAVSAILVIAIHLLSKKKPKDDYFEEVETRDEEKKEDHDQIKVKPIEVHDEVLTPKSELDLLLEQMQKDLENEKVDPTLSFEAEQEENAIISYEELLRANRQPVLSAEEEEKQPLIMSVKQYEKMQEKPVFTELDINEPVKSNKKFKNSEFISPIYGRINSNLDYPKIPSFRSNETKASEPVKEEVEEATLPSITDTISKKTVNTVELEKTLDLEKIMEEMKRNEEFLQALKEFRKNL